MTATRFQSHFIRSKQLMIIFLHFASVFAIAMFKFPKHLGIECKRLCYQYISSKKTTTCGLNTQTHKHLRTFYINMCSII